MFFDAYLIAKLSDTDKEFLISHCDKIDCGYRSKNGLSCDDYGRLIEIQKDFSNINHTDSFYIKLIAYYMYVHRENYKRYGDAGDDHFKAVYLFNLKNYLKEKGIELCLFKTAEMREEAIDMVNNIFDYAFYFKKAHPECSELQCFTEAERVFCEEKELDYIAYFEHSGNEKIDWENAKNKYREKLLSIIAFHEYLNRVENNLSGDAVADYFKAEKKYEEGWGIQKRIATLCWNKSNNSFFPKQYYWDKAREVMNYLEKENYQYKDKNPFGDEYIIEMVTKIV